MEYVNHHVLHKIYRRAFWMNVTCCYEWLAETWHAIAKNCSVLCMAALSFLQDVQLNKVNRIQVHGVLYRNNNNQQLEMPSELGI